MRAGPGAVFEVKTRLIGELDAEVAEDANQRWHAGALGEDGVESRRAHGEVEIGAPGVVEWQLELAEVDAEAVGEDVGGAREDVFGETGGGSEVEAAEVGPERQPILRAERLQMLAERFVPALQIGRELGSDNLAPGVFHLVSARDFG